MMIDDSVVTSCIKSGYSVHEFARQNGIPPTSLYRYFNEHRIPLPKYPSKLRKVDEKMIEQLLASDMNVNAFARSVFVAPSNIRKYFITHNLPIPYRKTIYRNPDLPRWKNQKVTHNVIKSFINSTLNTSEFAKEVGTYPSNIDHYIARHNIELPVCKRYNLKKTARHAIPLSKVAMCQTYTKRCRWLTYVSSNDPTIGSEVLELLRLNGFRYYIVARNGRNTLSGHWRIYVIDTTIKKLTPILGDKYWQKYQKENTRSQKVSENHSAGASHRRSEYHQRLASQESSEYHQ